MKHKFLLYKQRKEGKREGQRESIYLLNLYELTIPITLLVFLNLFNFRYNQAAKKR